MTVTSRREFIQNLSIAAAGIAVADLARAADNPDAMVAAAGKSPAFSAMGQPKPLPFDPAKLQGISEKLIKSHWENNYSGAVKALNTVREKLARALADKEVPPFVYNDLKREHLARTGSLVYHELYFENLGGDGQAAAGLRQQIGSAFGDFDTWETEFRKIANGLSGGSGWVVLGYNLHTAQLENYWLADHLHGAPTALPLLVMDMYEHAYQMDYGAAAARYIDAYFQNIRWEVVADRLEKARHHKA